ncbi:MAG TPA: HEPN/Toprim-associated domain-containing protein [Steroidobacteraceae bacterium]|nr:HEPN/Toprim-associated domain-containing protein [Steroidobacteraceae bacterium]
MGSMVHLALGPFEVDWGKNNSLRLHGEIFQSGDVTLVPDVYVGESDQHITEMQQGTSKPLEKVLPRLELLGYTLESSRAEFDSLVSAFAGGDLVVSFDDLAQALAKMDIDSAATDYHEDYNLGKFFAREIFDHLGLEEPENDESSGRYSRYELGEVVENLHPYVILRLLAENPVNLSRPVTWHYHDVVDNGWVRPETISDCIGDVRRFLVVTEGSSDAHIIRKAFELLRPEIADFFSFVDMQEGYPFTGTGNLRRFSQGLVAIGIENRVIVLYDNDLEGSLRFRDSSGLNLPANMRVIQLPSLPQLTRFRTVGPNGESAADINGRAAAIECYLDLAFGRSRQDTVPSVRWTSYNEGAEAYQGVLEFKEKYAKRYLNLRTRDPGYDFQKLEAVLEHIVASCVSMATASKLSESGLELERRV